MLEVAAGVLYLIGAGAIAIASVGLVRLPDIYCRLASVGVAGTIGVGALLLGRIAESPDVDTIMESALAMLLLAITSPVASHVIALGAHKAGYRTRTPKNAPHETRDT